MTNSNDVSRRYFLSRSALAGGAVAMPGLLSLGSAWPAGAAVPADYKALVCIQLTGGCDSLSLVTPLDSANYRKYQGYRQSVATAQGSLLPLVLKNNNAFGGKQVGLHPMLGDLSRLYASGKLAVVGSVGTTPAPLRKVNGAVQTVNGMALPPGLASHVDQYAAWLQQSRTGGRIGWGGLMADEFAAANGQPIITNISTSLYSPLLGGRTVNQFTVGSDGYPSSYYVDASSNTDIIAGNSAGRSNLLERQAATMYERLQRGAADLERSALPVSDFSNQPPDIELAKQLQTVLRIAGGAAATGMKRQIFYCSIGGFDTHSNQVARLDDVLGSLNASLAWFLPHAQRLGLFDKMTVFTTSEFGRSLVGNGDGTDHGWASHQLVLGGAVKGGDVYGSLPTIDTAGDDFNDSQMIPKVSVDQYGATFGKWMGLSEAQLASTFPDAANFSSRTLDFL